MSINLVSMAMKFVTPEMLLKLASATGLQGMIVQKALGAIVPAILGGLVGKAAKPDGARGLFDILGKMDPGMLGKIGGMIGGGGQADMVKQGTDLLGSILGGGAAKGMTGAVAKFAGIGDGPASMLMGLLAPAVLGTVGQQARESKLDAGGLASLLAGQKENIAAAMPGGFGDMLKGAGLGDSLMSGLSNVAGGAGAAASGAASHATAAASNVAGRASSMATDATKSSMSWLPWVLGAAVLAALGWYFLGGMQAPKVSAPAIPAASTVVSGATAATGQLTSAFDVLKTTLGGVKDADSAKAALPKLQGVVGSLDQITALADKLPADARKALAGTVGGLSPSIDGLFKTVLALPGVSEILKPVIDALQGKIAALGKA
jgi:hypothetical protein